MTDDFLTGSLARLEPTISSSGQIPNLATALGKATSENLCNNYSKNNIVWDNLSNKSNLSSC